MSIEQKISELTAAVTALTTALNQRAGAPTVPQAAAPVAQQFAAPQQAPAAAQQQMPALPSFAAAPAPAAAAPVQGAPFTDGAGLIAYVMGAYKEMGPTKGALIQGVLTQMGYQNVNDVKPEHYPALYQGVETLKRG